MQTEHSQISSSQCCHFAGRSDSGPQVCAQEHKFLCLICWCIQAFSNEEMQQLCSAGDASKWYMSHALYVHVQVFIDSKYKLAYNGRYTSDEEITGMLIAVLFAGQHTSSVTCTWTLLSMLANQVSNLGSSVHQLLPLHPGCHAQPNQFLCRVSTSASK